MLVNFPSTGKITLRHAAQNAKPELHRSGQKPAAGREFHEPTGISPPQTGWDAKAAIPGRAVKPLTAGDAGQPPAGAHGVSRPTNGWAAATGFEARPTPLPCPPSPLA